MTAVAARSSTAGTDSSTQVDRLQDKVTVVRDDTGIPHVFARNEQDLMFLQGWMHARDRLFQMDIDRRTAEGTVAELLGATAVEGDVDLRLFGVRRAAERSWPLLSSESQNALKAYTAGVNAYVARNPLPPEYAALEITAIRPWTDIDSLSVLSLVLFGQSFDLTNINRTNVLMRYRAVGTAQGFDGTPCSSKTRTALHPSTQRRPCRTRRAWVHRKPPSTVCPPRTLECQARKALSCSIRAS